jgi:8-oxo-dGTP pyrophosphatase MutT (NUDIX family)
MKIIKKIISLLKKKNYNVGFSEVNQPCFDKQGNFIGWFSRSMATAIFVFCRDAGGSLYVLASERGKGAADFQGYWNCPCGYLDFNETTKQCAIRELEEETGIMIPEDVVQFIGYEDNPVTANHQNVTFRFGANITDMTIDALSRFSKKHNEKNEVGRIAWIPVNGIDKYNWAFGHKARIVEVAHALNLI